MCCWMLLLLLPFLLLLLLCLYTRNRRKRNHRQKRFKNEQKKKDSKSSATSSSSFTAFLLFLLFILLIHIPPLPFNCDVERGAVLWLSSPPLMSHYRFFFLISRRYMNARSLCFNSFFFLSFKIEILNFILFFFLFLYDKKKNNKRNHPWQWCGVCVCIRPVRDGRKEDVVIETWNWPSLFFLFRHFRSFFTSLYIYHFFCQLKPTQLLVDLDGSLGNGTIYNMLFHVRRQAGQRGLFFPFRQIRDCLIYRFRTGTKEKRNPSRANPFLCHF